MPARLLSYDQLLRALPGGSRHLLLGNGSSISIHAAFAYPKLWNLVREELEGCPALQEFMDGCRNTDVEDALRGILHGNSVEPGMDAEDVATISKDHYELFQEAFIRAVARVHPEYPHTIDANMWSEFRAFLANFTHVFTLNYDLLLYWLNARAPVAERWVDGFLPGPDGRLRFTGNITILGRPTMAFLHGALHIYQEEEHVYKHAWEERGRGIIVQLHEALDRKQLPLFVSEGTSEHKGQKIAGNTLLAAGLQLLKNIDGTLITFGASFSESDRHIVRAIALNPNLRCLALGVYRAAALAHGEEVVAIVVEARRTAGLPELEVRYYDTSSVKPWGEHARVVAPPRPEPRQRAPAYVEANDPYEDDRSSKLDPPAESDPWAKARGDRWDV